MSNIERHEEKGMLQPSTLVKKRIVYDIDAGLSRLPPGQGRAIHALVGGEVARTYPEAARIAGVSLGTLLTHINRVRERHPRLYQRVRVIRQAQLEVRHEEALEAAKAHSRAWFRRKARFTFQLLHGMGGGRSPRHQ